MVELEKFWSVSESELFTALKTGFLGLDVAEANARLQSQRQIHQKKSSGWFLLARQFRNPLIILLMVALLLSALMGEYQNSAIIFSILLLSALLTFYQEFRAGKAMDKLQSMLKSKALVRREGKETEILIDQVVAGDIVLLKAGDIIPADCRLLQLKDLFVNESVITGESYPSEKKIMTLPSETPLIDCCNALFEGTSVVSGSAVALAVHVGKDAQLGKIELQLGSITEDTAFEKGIRYFGFMLMKAALVISLVIVFVNLLAGRNPIESILFAIALALGLTPEMLPAIVTITLSAGARRLTQKKVLVKKLSAIQNLGAIDVLCSDKTGTLTEGMVKIQGNLSPDGKSSQRIFEYAFLNAFFESGYANPIDLAIREQLSTDVSGYSKVDEVPYDFVRKRLSIVVNHNGRQLLISKGALKNILGVCTSVELSDARIFKITEYEEEIDLIYQQQSALGFRVIGVAYKDITGDPVINKDDEVGLCFLGLLMFYDPPKPDIRQVIDTLKEKQVSLKIITGDNTLIASNIARQIGISSNRILSGSQLHLLHDETLAARIDDIDIFSETEPVQKERIIRILQQKGHVVGYLGDGINDAPALKVADVGISVHSATDIARESADIILMEKELNVIRDGIEEGRKTYLNTLKYIFITISANFGNMFSMAGASLLLPFLPLLPAQILLTNFLTDLPALSIASDQVDQELLLKPRKWDIGLIKRFMIVFGLESSLFDYLTFGLLYWAYHASPEIFRTGWFMESVITEILILFVIRTRRRFYKSLPGKTLSLVSLFVILMVIWLPFSPFAKSLGIAPLPPLLVLIIGGVALLYAVTSEYTKNILFRNLRY
jgi:Mg2+-importing ATPase